MYIVNSYGLAVFFCFVIMLCWGSWGNTQKLAAKSWRYELFYWDYVIGMVLFALLLAFTFGSIGSQGRPFITDLGQASAASIGWILLGGVIFNASNILLSASISLAGMSVAFPLGVGIALVLGVLNNYRVALAQGASTGNVALLATGVALFAGSKKNIFTEETRVEFYRLDEFQSKLISDYCDSGSPYDKAGSYGIQDMGALLIKRIDGDYSNVVGLPVARLARELANLL